MLVPSINTQMIDRLPMKFILINVSNKCFKIEKES
jgi:hypothetical protein